MDMRKQHIGVMRGQGKTFHEIGTEVGLSDSRVYHICQEDEVKSLIQDVTLRLINNGVSIAADNMLQEVKNYSSKKSVKERELSLRYSERILESAGVLKNQQGNAVTNILNQTQNIISPVVIEVLEDFQRRCLSPQKTSE